MPRKNRKKSRQQQILDEHAPFKPPSSEPDTDVRQEETHLNTQGEKVSPLVAQTVETSVVSADLPEAPPAKRSARRQRHSGWMGIVSVFFIVVVLGIPGLFLPPFLLFERLTDAGYVDNPYHYTRIDASEPEISLDGLTLRTDGEDTYRLRLNTVSATRYITGVVPETRWNCPAVDTLPAYLTPVETIYSIERRGEAPEDVEIAVPLPEAASGNHDLYAFDPAIARWRYVPAQLDVDRLRGTVRRLPLCVMLVETESIPLLRGGVAQIDDHFEEPATRSLNRLYVRGLYPAPDGSLVGALPAEVVIRTTVVPVVSNVTSPFEIDVATLEILLNSPVLRQEHITRLINFVDTNGYDSLAIDYRGLRDISAHRENLNRFFIELSRGLHAKGYTLHAVLPFPARQENGEWHTGAYDWQTTGEAVDAVIVSLPRQPDFYETDFQSFMQWAVRRVNRYHLLPGISMRSLQEIDGRVLPLDWRLAINPLTESFCDTLDSCLVAPLPEGYEREAQSINGTVHFTFRQDNQVVAETWLLTPDTLKNRLEQFDRFHPGGVVIMDMFTGEMLPGITDAFHPLW